MKKSLKHALAALAASASLLAAPLAWSQAPTGGKAYITFTFDDAPVSVYTNAGPLFAKYGFPATLFVITNAVAGPAEQSWHMDWNQIHDLYQQGWEIGSHSHTHPYLTQISDADLSKEVEQSFSALAQEQLHPEVFASPYGDYNAKVVKAIAKRFTMHRRTFGADPELNGFNDTSSLDWMDISAHVVTAGESAGDLSALIDQAIQENQWLVLCFHGIVKGTPATEYEYGYADLDAILQYAYSAGISVVNFEQMRGIVGDK
ncbi:MAG: polysaccharide deacetylase family protein [Thiohalocapsa sp.]|jgi:peptidoglycan/xylan/chitin deacetylase (PgdA/CDA1 family)|uniref:polysaccharide deacetylase family protein n=1 Tax=Thiohalocapsa sp. TaxID=2497641 RepID=UPI0025F9DE70|nr:polysaccharide deacetylase family protein [Thiohalocapsa sp.]MCG6942038.1 polysaccharide deacetylase family protein [Thiohalocapsa sp.]